MGNGGCCKFSRERLQSVDAKSYEPLLHQEEKEAVNNLLKYYDEGTKIDPLCRIFETTMICREFSIDEPFT